MAEIQLFGSVLGMTVERAGGCSAAATWPRELLPRIQITCRVQY